MKHVQGGGPGVVSLKAMTKAQLGGIMVGLIELAVGTQVEIEVSG